MANPFDDLRQGTRMLGNMENAQTNVQSQRMVRDQLRESKDTKQAFDTTSKFIDGDNSLFIPDSNGRLSLRDPSTSMNSLYNNYSDEEVSELLNSKFMKSYLSKDSAGGHTFAENKKILTPMPVKNAQGKPIVIPTSLREKKEAGILTEKETAMFEKYKTGELVAYMVPTENSKGLRSFISRFRTDADDDPALVLTGAEMGAALEDAAKDLEKRQVNRFGKQSRLGTDFLKENIEVQGIGADSLSYEGTENVAKDQIGLIQDKRQQVLDDTKVSPGDKNTILGIIQTELEKLEPEKNDILNGAIPTVSDDSTTGTDVPDTPQVDPNAAQRISIGSASGYTGNSKDYPSIVKRAIDKYGAENVFIDPAQNDSGTHNIFDSAGNKIGNTGVRSTKSKGYVQNTVNGTKVENVTNIFDTGTNVPAPGGGTDDKILGPDNRQTRPNALVVQNKAGGYSKDSAGNETEYFEKDGKFYKEEFKEVDSRTTAEKRQQKGGAFKPGSQGVVEIPETEARGAGYIPVSERDVGKKKDLDEPSGQALNTLFPSLSALEGPALANAIETGIKSGEFQTAGFSPEAIKGMEDWLTSLDVNDVDDLKNAVEEGKVKDPYHTALMVSTFLMEPDGTVMGQPFKEATETLFNRITTGDLEKGPADLTKDYQAIASANQVKTTYLNTLRKDDQNRFIKKEENFATRVQDFTDGDLYTEYVEGIMNKPEGKEELATWTIKQQKWKGKEKGLYADYIRLHSSSSAMYKDAKGQFDEIFKGTDLKMTPAIYFRMNPPQGGSQLIQQSDDAVLFKLGSLLQEKGNNNFFKALNPLKLIGKGGGNDRIMDFLGDIPAPNDPENRLNYLKNMFAKRSAVDGNAIELVVKSGYGVEAESSIDVAWLLKENILAPEELAQLLLLLPETQG